MSDRATTDDDRSGSPGGRRDPSTLTGDDNYFEDFREGDVYRHARGKTISTDEMHGVVHMTMNTAEVHFNADKMADSEFGERINFGGLTMSVVLGLASEDTTENAVRLTGLDEVRFHEPVRVGDTVYAVTEVLETDAAPDPEGSGPDDRPAGLVRFKHYGLNGEDDLVFSGVQEVLIAKRPTDR
jgi:acyl dehydratase